ncbi:MAG: MopE-related protein [Myxococcota bacterium]|nr:MopE-related protein [Myxococcota bacterium]
MRIWTTLMLMTGGCTWISQADIDARQDDVDDDGDGFLAVDDCDDDDDTINPGVEEVWYDGIDADCAGDDDYDADTDGYVPDSYFGLTTAGVDGTGLLADGDCDDTDSGIYPTAVDTWYDGTDTDCVGNNDYDADADGYVSDEFVDDAGLPGGDCDDTNEDYSPGIDEAWYDGIDADCAGDNDYDADADGYVSDIHEGLKTAGQPTSDRLDGGDCDDSSAAFSPGVVEIWYDGDDADCAGDNDYDADADGYTPEAYKANAGLPDGDCDDTDEDVNPSSMEVLSDVRDLDCDGSGDSMFALEMADFTGWSSPTTPRFDQNVSAIYLSLITEQVTISGLTYYDSAIAIAFDPTDPLAGPQEVYPWLKHTVDPSSYSLTAGHDFVVTNSHILGITGLLFSTHRTMRLGGYDLSATQLDGALFNTPSGDLVDAFTDMSLAQDSDGMLHGIGCDDTTGVVQYFSTPLASAVDDEIDNTEILNNFEAQACELHLLDSPTGSLISSQSTGLVTDTFDTTASGLTLVADNLNSAYTPFAIEVPDGGAAVLVVIADPDAIYVFEDDIIHYTQSLTSAPISVQASYDPDTGDLLIAYADDAGDAWLLLGDPTTGTMDEYSISIDFSATDAAAWIYNSVVTVAVTGTNELALGAAEL